MRVFHCNHCNALVFFENTQCTNCGWTLAYVPELTRVIALEPADGELWKSPLRNNARARFRLCDNYSQQHVCNWALPADDPLRLCRSCRLTRVIPDLSLPDNRIAWYKLEAAKRRLLYTLMQLRCPLDPPPGGEGALVYEFKGDADGVPVMTGHSDGVITVNMAEADDAERERRRLQMREPYRTLLGHFRHESGHYYWQRLIANAPRIEEFRALFGDERQNYAEALQRHYDNPPPADWQQNFVSSYATSHPWEDWAESWAHYLHMTDMLETAADGGLLLHPGRRDEPRLRRARSGTGEPFEQLIQSWFPLTYILNNLNRSMGLADGYPFVLSSPAIAKLRFIHETLAALP